MHFRFLVFFPCTMVSTLSRADDQFPSDEPLTKKYNAAQQRFEETQRKFVESRAQKMALQREGLRTQDEKYELGRRIFTLNAVKNREFELGNVQGAANMQQQIDVLVEKRNLVASQLDALAQRKAPTWSAFDAMRSERANAVFNARALHTLHLLRQPNAMNHFERK